MGENGGGGSEQKAQASDHAEDAGDTSAVAKNSKERRADKKARVPDADGGSDACAGGHTGDMAGGTIKDWGDI